MITIQQKENIKKLLGEKQSQEKIAKRLGVTRHQVRQIIAQLKQKKGKAAGRRCHSHCTI